MTLGLQSLAGLAGSERIEPGDEARAPSASKCVEMDLRDLFAKLGVIVDGAGRISFDGKALLACLRCRLTTK